MTGQTHKNGKGDLVLVHYDDQPAVYARIEAIELDVKRGWYQVSLLLLTIPAQAVTWILREEYINGAPFTMGGHPMRLEGVQSVQLKAKAQDVMQSSRKKGKGRPAKVISLKSKS
jgi:hypothetical protein